MRSHSWWHDHSQDQQDHQYDHTYKWCYLGMQRPNEQWQRLWSWAINSNAGTTIHKISKITKKLQLTGPTSPSRSVHNERSLQRLWGYIIIVFNVWKFEIQTQEGRTKPLSSYYWQWPPVLFSFLSIGMNSFQKAQAEARGPSPVPELFIWKLMIWGELQKTQDIEMPKTPNKIVKKNLPPLMFPFQM